MGNSSQRVTRLSNGGYVRVSEAIMQGAGPAGPQGPDGPRGVGTRIVGTISQAAFDALNPTPDQDGWAWIISDGANEGVAFGWNEPDQAWDNIGRIVGPPGYLNSVMGEVTATGTAQSIPGNTETLVTFNGFTTDTEFIEDTVNPQDPPIEAPVVATPAGSTFTSFGVGSPNTAVYVVSVNASFDTTTTVAGQATMRLYRDGAVVSEFSQYFNGLFAPNQDIDVTWIGSADDSTVFEVKVWTSVELRVDEVQVQLARTGGGVGPAGPDGPAGSPAHYEAPVNTLAELQAITGKAGEMRLVSEGSTRVLYGWNTATGPGTSSGWVAIGDIRGPTGSANSGFSTFDDVAGVDSTSPPAAGGTTPETDQSVILPSGTNSPAVPWFMRTLWDTVKRRLVSRFSSESSWFASRPTRENGEMVFIDPSTGSTGGYLEVHDSRYPNESQIVPGLYPLRIPFIIYSTSAAAGTTTAPDGTLYIQHGA